MKYLFLLLACTIAGSAAHAHATIPGGDGTKLNLWIPGLIVKSLIHLSDDYVSGSDMENMDLSNVISKIGNINICIREGNCYDANDAKINRKLNRMEKRDYKELLSISDSEADVQMHIRQNKKGAIKRVVIFIDETGETLVYLKIHCRVDMRDLRQGLQYCTPSIL